MHGTLRRTWPRLATRLSCQAALLFTLTAAGATETIIPEGPWLKVTNSNFHVLTNTSERRAVEIMEDMDRFRAAIERITSWRRPAGSPPADVVILQNGYAEISRLTRSSGFSVYAQQPGQPARRVVVLAAKPGADYEEFVQHMYVHIVTSARGMRVPVWYDEGLAETYRYTRIQDDEIVVDVPKNVIRGFQFYSGLGLDSWQSYDDIVADAFDPHRPSGDPFSYLQCWLLAHYLTFGATDLGPSLQKYLIYYDSGMSSLSAFRLAFGMSPEEMWKTKLGAYSKDFRKVTYKINSPVRGEAFTVVPADSDAVAAMMAALRTAVDLEIQKRLPKP